MSRNLAIAFMLSHTVLIASCAHTHTAILLENHPGFPKVPAESVGVLQPGDGIDIKFQYWSEMDDSQTIRPDGKITLQMLDDVQAAGLTPEQLDAKLTQLYQDKLKEPELSVIVRSLANRSVFVTGEVFTPGEIELKNKMTLLGAIMSAGGFNKSTAELSNVIVIRHLNGKRYAAALNLHNMLMAPESDPFYLTSQDIVYLPRTRIVDLNDWVDQHITKMIPSTGSFTYEITRSTENGGVRYGAGK